MRLQRSQDDTSVRGLRADNNHSHINRFGHHINVNKKTGQIVNFEEKITVERLTIERVETRSFVIVVNNIK